MKFDPKTVQIRGYNSTTDVAFVVNSLLKSYRNSAPCQDISNPVYYTFHAEFIETTLRDPKTACLMLCAADDPDQIMGYIIFNVSMPVLHYVYIKQVFRQLGLGGFLVRYVSKYHQEKTLQCTHVAKRWKKKAKDFNLTYNPYVIRYASTSEPQASPLPAGGDNSEPASLVP